MRLGGVIQYSGFSNGVRYVLGWCCVFVTMLPDTIDDSSTSTRGLYFRPSQLCLLKRIRDFKGLLYLNLGHSYSSFFYFGNVVVSFSPNVHAKLGTCLYVCVKLRVDKTSVLISLKFEISRQRKVEGEQVKRAGTNGA